MLYRQGDVLLKPVEWVKGEWNAATRLGYGRDKRGDIILAAGEATGHHHHVKRGTFARRAVRREGRQILLVSKRGATVSHEEHDPIAIPAGAYEIVRQREFNPPAVKDTTRTSSANSSRWSYVSD